MVAKCMFLDDTMAEEPGAAERMKRKCCSGNNAGRARDVECKPPGREKVPADL